ncbi:MAG: NAD-dependent epimerase/dehydratase family protein [Candidatus Moranbacteria bacterium]|nr:NAD-dependent epimerase/dehydratase family protein [Candidatus Moranbacteria bacterium]
MRYNNILITGGAGFVGSSLAIKLKEKYPKISVTALDNLKRRGSELNLARLKEKGIVFLHGDIRNKEDFEEIGKTDLLLECSAEPSVLAGIGSSPEYLINTNLLGTINCLEFARTRGADFMFLSSSRVYPIETLNNLNFIEGETRFSLSDRQSVAGVSAEGVSEGFPLSGARSLYGATKLCSELMLQEYCYNYGVKSIINRCGVITGPWQMGKVDQGVFVLWVAKHIFGGKLTYIGYGGEGKQVRDFIHVSDLFDIIDIQLNDFPKFSGQTFNVGGGLGNSVSLCELTKVCEEITGNKIKISKVREERPADLKLFIANCAKIKKITGWQPKKDIKKTISDIAEWILKNKKKLKPILS